ncbi:hypothetical protein [Magpiepox virus]|nr:hypothetical protein [Magpiepox virus]
MPLKKLHNNKFNTSHTINATYFLKTISYNIFKKFF